VYISHQTHIISHHTHNAVPNVQGVDYCRRICSLGAMLWPLTKHHSYQWRFFQICWLLFQSPYWILGISNLRMILCYSSFVTQASIVIYCLEWDCRCFSQRSDRVSSLYHCFKQCL